MGRVCTAKVKRIAKEVLQRYEGSFTEDYTKNKEVLRSILDTESKKLLNQITGFVTRTAKAGAARKAEAVVAQEA